MAVVYSNELLMANSSKMLSILDDVYTTTNDLINKIKIFISNSRSNLSGDIFIAVNTKLSLYLDALKKQNQICINLKSNIKAANNSMINYMEGYEKLDDGDIEELKAVMNQVNGSIQYLETQDKTLNTSLKSDINRLYEIYGKLNKLYKKLEGLASADSEAFSKIETVQTDISNYSSAIRTVKVGWGKTSFFNLGNRDIVYYSQLGHEVDGKIVEWNSRWNKNIKDAGCGPTSYAMVIGTMLHDSTITPETIGDMMNGKKLSNGSNFIYSISEEYGVNCVQGKYNLDALEVVLKNGGGFIGSARKGGHYIAVTDVVYDNNGQRFFVLCDPYPPFNSNKNEPTLVTDQELANQQISMDFYITPPNVEVKVTEDSKKIISIENKATNEIIYF